MLIISSDTDPVYAEHRKVWSSYMNSYKDIECYFIQYRDGPQAIEGNTFWLRGKESFPNILSKTIDSIKYFLKNDYDFIIRTNLSSLWNFKVLLDYLQTLPREGVYNGFIGSHKNSQFASGSGYIMTPDICDLLIENRQVAESYGEMDDTAVGFTLNKLGINPSIGRRNDRMLYDENSYHYRFVCHSTERMKEASHMMRVLENFYSSTLLTIKHDNGRFCNQLIRCIASSFIAEKHNLKINYSIPNELSLLGIELFCGEKMFDTTAEVNDSNYFDILTGSLFSNIDPNKSFFQTRDIIQKVYEFIQCKKEFIVSANQFKDRYENNNDCFVHVRLSDASQWNPGFEYYDKAISQLRYDKLYISTDEASHDIVNRLVNKYSATLLQLNEVTTIKFASTCKHIILSHGTFSSCIGYFSFFSHIYYPEFSIAWHGDIFLPSWSMIYYKQMISKDDIITSDKYLNAFPSNYHKTDIVVSKTQTLWRNKMSYPPNKESIIISGHSDYGITDELVAFYNPKIWWTINKETSDSRVHSLPLGITNDTSETELHPIYGDLDSMIRVMNEPKQDKNLLYMNFNIYTFFQERQHVYNLFQGKEWVTKGMIENTIEGRTRFLREIRNHTFVLCPRGNGIDTHRLWETLYMGSIPIVRRDVGYLEFEDLPICFVNSWNEVTYEFLLLEKKRISNNSWNMDKLKVSYWINKIKETF